MTTEPAKQPPPPKSIDAADPDDDDDDDDDDEDYVPSASDHSDDSDDGGISDSELAYIQNDAPENEEDQEGGKKRGGARGRGTKRKATGAKPAAKGRGKRAKKDDDADSDAGESEEAPVRRVQTRTSALLAAMETGKRKRTPSPEKETKVDLTERPLDAEEEARKKRLDAIWKAMNTPTAAKVRSFVVYWWLIPLNSTRQAKPKAESTEVKEVVKTYKYAGEVFNVTEKVRAPSSSTPEPSHPSPAPTTPADTAADAAGPTSSPAPSADPAASPTSSSSSVADAASKPAVRKVTARKSNLLDLANRYGVSKVAAKLNTLDKSKLDWIKHVEAEGDADKLKKHNKDGHLAKMDFLNRTVERQRENVAMMKKAIIMFVSPRKRKNQEPEPIAKRLLRPIDQASFYPKDSPTSPATAASPQKTPLKTPTKPRPDTMSTTPVRQSPRLAAIAAAAKSASPSGKRSSLALRFGSAKKPPVAPESDAGAEWRKMVQEVKEKTEKENCFLVWRVFGRQSEAFKWVVLFGGPGTLCGMLTFLRRLQDRSVWPLRVFSFEHDVQNPGKRKFLVTTYADFWEKYVEMKPEERVYYELIREGCPCKLYFDLEYNKAANPNHDGERMISTLKSLVSDDLLTRYNIKVKEEAWIDLSSSTDAKFSRHLILNLPMAVWKDNGHVGRFVAHLCTRIRNRVFELVERSAVEVLREAERREAELLKGLFVEADGSGPVEEAGKESVVEAVKEAGQEERPAEKEMVDKVDGDEAVVETEGEGEKAEVGAAESGKEDQIAVETEKLVAELELQQAEKEVASDEAGAEETVQEAAVVEQVSADPTVSANPETPVPEIAPAAEPVAAEPVPIAAPKGTLFIDAGVYTRNRNFRVLLSTKLGKSAPLVPSPRTALAVSLLSVRTPSELEEGPGAVGDGTMHPDSAAAVKQMLVGGRRWGREAFVSTLVGAVQWKAGCRILTVDEEEVVSAAAVAAGLVPKTGTGSKAAFVEASPFAEVDEHVLRWIREEVPGSERARLSGVAYFPDSKLVLGVVFCYGRLSKVVLTLPGKTITYGIAGTRYCHNIQRQHKSNGVYYVAELSRGVFSQRCHDPDCKHFRSREQEIPERLSPFESGADEVEAAEGDGKKKEEEKKEAFTREGSVESMMWEDGGLDDSAMVEAMEKAMTEASSSVARRSDQGVRGAFQSSPCGGRGAAASASTSTNSTPFGERGRVGVANAVERLAASYRKVVEDARGALETGLGGEDAEWANRVLRALEEVGAPPALVGTGKARVEE
ncbi:hypothetical protein HDU96_000110 [Phlyctochytrium bullatum]|nr:hypothetical protein HDU96_000110 [Phlyctochytrium bullatum]